MLSPIRRWKQSLHLRMSVALSLLIILAMTTVAAIQLLHLRTALTAAAENRAQAIGRTFVMIGSAAVTENLFRIQEALLRYDDEKDIAELDFVDDDHMIVAALHPKRIGKIVTDATFANAQAQARETLTQSETAGGDPRLVVWEPLYEGPAINGWVRIEFSLTPLQEETIRWGKTLAVFTVLLIIVGMAIIQLALRRISGFFTDTIGQLQKTLVALRSSAVVKASVHDGGIGLPSAHTSTQHGTLEQLASVIATTAELLNAQATSLNTFTTSLEELVRERTNQLIQANVTLQRDEQTLRSHQDALLQLTKNIHTEQLEEALRQITETAAQTLDVQRTSIWFYTEERTGIECKDLHEASHRRHSSGMTLKAADFPRYFNELLHQQIIAVTDARSDPRTCEFTASYLNPLGITSMLNTHVTHNGQMYGVICLEHTGEPRTWTVEEQQFSASLANLVALALETAERTQAEQALRSSEQRTRSIIETALDAVISITHDGIITEWNRRAEIVFGWRSEEAVGRQIADTIIPPQHRDAHRMRLQRYLETGEGSVLDQRIEITALRRDGSEFPIELAIAPIRFADSCSFTAFISDISTRKQAQEALRQAKESAESATNCSSRNTNCGITSVPSKKPVSTISAIRPSMITLVSRILKE